MTSNGRNCKLLSLPPSALLEPSRSSQDAFPVSAVRINANIRASVCGNVDLIRPILAEVARASVQLLL
jgi:hypothetical protein